MLHPMSVQRRRDPRLPGPALEDVETIVNGERVTSYELSDTDKLIASAQQDALDQVRVMWGLDRDDWLMAIEELAKAHPEVAKVILCRWCDISVAAAAHDSREPDEWGWLKLADLYHRAGDHGAEHDVLAEWLSHWPADRDTAPRARARIIERLEKDRCGVHRGQAQEEGRHP
jgi:hypothetical protein